MPATAIGAAEPFDDGHEAGYVPGNFASRSSAGAGTAVGPPVSGARKR
jgi:hypothetical protein